MDEMTLKFSDNDVGINFDEFINNREINGEFRRLFNNVILEIVNIKDKKSGLPTTGRFITIDTFIDVLEKNGWNIPCKDLKPEYKNVDPKKYVDYIFNSRNKKITLHLFFPTKEYNVPYYKKQYEKALDKLLSLSKDAVIIGDDNLTSIRNNENILNISNIQEKSEKSLNGAYTPNLKLIKNGIKHGPSIRKILKTKKGKIVLCTIIGFTIVAGSVIAYAVSERIETQKVIDENKQYSYQVDSSSDSINRNRQLYETIKQGEVDSSLANPNEHLEKMKMEYNTENYQNVR